jgi:dTDP-4-amino-4,6-dideoxygalactose transaminase
MDVLQSKILDFRLTKLNRIIKKRRKLAQIYFENLDTKKIKFVKEKKNEFNTYHTFIIHSKKRDNLKNYLLKKGIETAIHYPVPIHLQPAAKKLNYKRGDFPVTEKQSKEILTLPINQYLNKKDILYVCKIINEFNN